MFFTLNSLQLGIQLKMHEVSEGSPEKGRGKVSTNCHINTAMV